ncbi:MAG: ABC-F type ribosomal protection protein [Clostridiales bacterium]|nr:ABC-F type ribosomal protection protein [Clostridiales bacterium]
MSQITVNNLSFSYDTAYDMIFENVSFQIDTDWKLGFIGRNGRGKTTFLNLLMGKYEYRGDIMAPVNFDYFPFEIERIDRTTMDIAKDIIAPFREWEQEMELCLLRQQQDIKEGRLNMEDSDVSHHMNRYGELQELYQKHDGYIIEELIEKELGRLKVDLSVLTRPFSSLSFGERTKVMLAALFLKKNNFLLIDEPTNHLDMEGREVLADYLQTKAGFILVSHDRSFLDKCIDHVLSINRTNIEVQKGNFSSWHHNKVLNDNYEIEKNKQLKKDIASLSEAARRATGWSDKVEASKIGDHVFDRGYVGRKSAKMMKRAKAIESRKLEAIEEKKGLLKDIEEVDSLKMNLLAFHSKRFIELENVSLFYGSNEIASNIDLLVRVNDRIAVRGKNGSGKSTLFKLLLGKGISYTGNVFIAQGLKISYVSQDTSYLEGSLTDFVLKYGLDETIFKTVLRQLDFERGQFDKDISSFSQGQKKKVLLAKSLSEPAHLFFWDEPLNYIDVLSRVQIEELILAFCPTLVFVEHDRIFTEKIATKEIHL